MARANQAQTSLAFITEVTPGTTPATPGFTTVRATGEGLTVDRKLAFSNELNGKRGQKNYALASQAGGGNFKFEWSANTLDVFLESALRNAWATNVLTDANTPKSFTLETKFETGTTDLYKRVTGAEVNTLTLDLKAGEVITGTCALLGRDGTFANAIVAGATYTAGNTEPIMVGAKVANIALAGLTLDGIAGISLNITNKLTQKYALGQMNPFELVPGGLEITGNIMWSLADTDFDIMTNYKDALTTGLTFEINTVAGKITRFEMPVIVMDDFVANAESADGDLVMGTTPFRALQASTLSNSVIRVTRNI